MLLAGVFAGADAGVPRERERDAGVFVDAERAGDLDAAERAGDFEGVRFGVDLADAAFGGRPRPRDVERERDLDSLFGVAVLRERELDDFLGVLAAAFGAMISRWLTQRELLTLQSLASHELTQWGRGDRGSVL